MYNRPLVQRDAALGNWRPALTAVAGGVDLPTVPRSSGHQTLAMVARYAHQNGAHIQPAMGKLGWRAETKDAGKVFGLNVKKLS